VGRFLLVQCALALAGLSEWGGTLPATPSSDHRTLTRRTAAPSDSRAWMLRRGGVAAAAVAAPPSPDSAAGARRPCFCCGLARPVPFPPLRLMGGGAHAALVSGRCVRVAVVFPCGGGSSRVFRLLRVLRRRRARKTLRARPWVCREDVQAFSCSSWCLHMHGGLKCTGGMPSSAAGEVRKTRAARNSRQSGSVLQVLTAVRLIVRVALVNDLPSGVDSFL